MQFEHFLPLCRGFVFCWERWGSNTQSVSKDNEVSDKWITDGVKDHLDDVRSGLDGAAETGGQSHASGG